MNLAIRDHQIIWHPFTQQKTMDAIIEIKKAIGNYLYDYQDNKYLDLISSWWVNLHGHANPIIAEAIYQQALTLEHVIFAGFTHAPAVKLCESILKKLPENLSKGFYSDNGSTSVEVALKMAYQYWCNIKQPKKKLFLSFVGGYHGDTFGAMSVGIRSGFHQLFKQLCFEVLFIPFPGTFDGDQELLDKEEQALNKVKDYLFQYKHQIAAIILEPLVQGANGMQICRPNFLNKLLDVVKSENILVIFDEVMTGFGRTGTFFAVEQLNVKPDLICLSKGISGGFLPLGLTVASEKIYQAFLGNDFKVAFGHGHSYTANPLACAAGIASFNLLESHKTQQAIKKINKTHKIGIELLKDNCKKVHKLRVLGTIAAFEVSTQNPNFNRDFKQACLKQGLLLRPLGNTVYFLPPYSITTEELLNAYSNIINIINLDI